MKLPVQVGWWTLVFWVSFCCQNHSFPRRICRLSDTRRGTEKEINQEKLLCVCSWLMRQEHTEILKGPNVFKRNMTEDCSRMEGRCCRLVPGCDWYQGCCMEHSYSFQMFFFSYFEIASSAVWLPESFSIFPLCVPLLSINHGWQRKHPMFPGECGSHPEATQVILEDTDRWALLWLSSGTRGRMMDHHLLSSPAQHFLLIFQAAKNEIQIFRIISWNWAH